MTNIVNIFWQSGTQRCILCTCGVSKAFYFSNWSLMIATIANTPRKVKAFHPTVTIYYQNSVGSWSHETSKQIDHGLSIILFLSSIVGTKSQKWLKILISHILSSRLLFRPNDFFFTYYYITQGITKNK